MAVARSRVAGFVNRGIVGKGFRRRQVAILGIAIRGRVHLFARRGAAGGRAAGGVVDNRRFSRGCGRRRGTPIGRGRAGRHIARCCRFHGTLTLRARDKQSG